jgi:serine/threonine-protein kinase
VPERYLGQTLGKYRIESLLGSGGFAWVFKGYDPELDIPVAVKVLKPQFAGEPPVVERFKREAATAARLRHPNIIKIYSVGRDGTAVYFVMDYLPGGLSDRLEVTSTLPEDYVLRVGVDVARALGFAHREGVIHRDIKVDNILFDTHGNAVVADFGIARALSGYTNQTGTNMVVGTPQYFAPEQARAKPLDGRADIYSLGVTLFRSATGRLPFEGEDWYEIARQHVEEPPPSPRSINQALSPEFEALVLKCMEKSADDRWATGEELADAMLDVLHARRDVSAASTVSVPSATGTTPRTRRTFSAARPAPRRALIPAAIITTVVIGGLAALIAWPFGGNNIVTGTPADSLTADSTGDTTGFETPVVIGDSGTRPTPSGTTGTTRPPRSVFGSLRVTAPPDARVTLNDSLIGRGNVSTDSLRPGEYLLVAEVPAFEGCTVNRITRPTRVEAGRIQSVVLNVVRCGTVRFGDVSARTIPDNKPIEGRGIFFTFEPDSGSGPPEGRLPLSSPIVLRPGKWTLILQMAGCSPYREDFTVEPGEQQLLQPIRIECARN